MTLISKPNPASAVPIYLQLKDQIRHLVEVGALRPGEPLPALRLLAEQLVVNANTIARVYRELEQEGLLELRHGVGAFVTEFGPVLGRTQSVLAAQPIVRELVRSLRERGLSADEIRRMVDAELSRDGLPPVPSRLAAIHPGSTAP
jgi:GntR family transcriptional regulator